MAKSLVETCHEKAASTCTQQHQQRRILVAQSLESIAAQFSADPSCLVPQLELILGALAYARDEILWYFLHVNEVRCGTLLNLVVSVVDSQPYI